MQLQFTKMHGCGNDYIYVNGFTQQVPQGEKPALVRRLSDRHFGVGGDGVIFINPSKIADFEMEMYNMDGSRGEMCGNGIRCVGKYVYDRGMTDGRTTFTVASCGKIKILELACEGEKALTVRVNMGAPIMEPAKIPAIPAEGFPKEEPILMQPVEARGRPWQVTCISMGNPHAVIFLTPKDITALSGKDQKESEPIEEDRREGESDGGNQRIDTPALSLRDLDLTGIGPQFENHSRFPNRINTEFVQVVDRRHVKMRVWERGTGETLACGTGACAVAVAGVLNGLTDRKVEIQLPGGTLLIEWDEESGDVYLTGPAEEVFEGTIKI